MRCAHTTRIRHSSLVTLTIVCAFVHPSIPIICDRLRSQQSLPRTSSCTCGPYYYYYPSHHSSSIFLSSAWPRFLLSAVASPSRTGTVHESVVCFCRLSAFWLFLYACFYLLVCLPCFFCLLWCFVVFRSILFWLSLCPNASPHLHCSSFVSIPSTFLYLHRRFVCRPSSPFFLPRTISPSQHFLASLFQSLCFPCY